METDAPTVVVTRRARRGFDADAGRWLDTLTDAAARFPGFVGADTQPPGEAHPDTWVTTYRFDTLEHLSAWTDSSERHKLVDRGSRYIDGPGVEQRIAIPRHQVGTATAIVSKTLKPGALGDYRRGQAEIGAAMSRFPGFTGWQVAEPVPGVQNEHVTTFTFDTRENLDAWLNSDEREDVLEMIQSLVVGDMKLSVVGGFAGWFDGGEAEPPRWKQAVTILIALFPTVVVLSYIQDAIAPNAPRIPAIFVSNVVGIIALTWLLVPPLTRLLKPWLTPK
ncbi:MAG: hypothetical protein GY708_27645 [Actinomycetia bacterium]|nr:hypothetical protein [Actinomycetes bacterium]MCP4959848.1 hypothetical protein [Actinomycetes bacterium]